MLLQITKPMCLKINAKKWNYYEENEIMHMLCLAWHKICTQMLAAIISYYCLFYFLSHLLNSRVVYTSILNFNFILSLLNSNFCPHFINKIGTVVAEFTFLYFSAACGTFDCFHLKASLLGLSHYTLLLPT